MSEDAYGGRLPLVCPLCGREAINDGATRISKAYRHADGRCVPCRASFRIIIKDKVDK